MDFLISGLVAITWKQLVMYLIGLLLIYLAIKKEYEPSLLLPMGFGAILVNLPFSSALNQVVSGVGETQGIVEWLFHIGIEASEALPILLFIGIGAMIDFGPLLSKPALFLYGAAAQFGIFAALILATLLGFDLKDAASISIIGAADGPTSILVSQILHSNYIGAIAVAAYSLYGVGSYHPALCHPACHYQKRTDHDHELPGLIRFQKSAYCVSYRCYVYCRAHRPDQCFPCRLPHVRQSDPGMRRPWHHVRDCTEYPCQSDHSVSWHHYFLQYAGGKLRQNRYPADHGDRTLCLYFRYHWRCPVCQIPEPVPEGKDQSHGWCGWHFCLSHVLKSSTEAGSF